MVMVSLGLGSELGSRCGIRQKMVKCKRIGVIRCVRMWTRIRHTDTDTANRIATCSDSKRIRTQNARSIHRSDVDTWGFSSSVAWQSFEVVPNVIGPTSTTCERVVHQPAVVHYYVSCVLQRLDDVL